jgi:hypothetical protein
MRLAPSMSSGSSRRRSPCRSSASPGPAPASQRGGPEGPLRRLQLLDLEIDDLLLPLRDRQLLVREDGVELREDRCPRASCLPAAWERTGPASPATYRLRPGPCPWSCRRHPARPAAARRPAAGQLPAAGRSPAALRPLHRRPHRCPGRPRRPASARLHVVTPRAALAAPSQRERASSSLRAGRASTSGARPPACAASSRSPAAGVLRARPSASASSAAPPRADRTCRGIRRRARRASGASRCGSAGPRTAPPRSFA